MTANQEYWRQTNFARQKLERFTAVSVADRRKGTASQGIVFKELTKAAQENTELVRKYLGRGFAGREEKFLQQNDANWKSGSFLYIPKNCSAENPFTIQITSAEANQSTFPRTVIVLDQGATATVFLHSTSPHDTENFINSVTEIYLEANSKLELVEVQDFSSNTIEITQKRVELSDHANLHWTLIVNGAKVSKTNLETVLNGEGAEAEVAGLLLAKGKQHLELFSNTQHRVPHTQANILVKASVRDKAKTVFQGMIRIEKEAQQTNSYMSNRNLVLSKTAHADSIPRLEIEANDVKASHGASIGELDREQLFYLRSKGLDKVAAEQLLMEGFYEEVLGKIASPEIREKLKDVQCRTNP